MAMRPSRTDRQRGKAGICAILGAAGGLILGTVTATLSPGLVFRTAAVAGLGSMPATANMLPGEVRTLPRLALAGHAFDYHLARPAGPTSGITGVLVVPGPSGITDGLIDLSDRLASEGYLVLLTDRDDPGDGPMPTSLLGALVDHLSQTPEVDGRRMAVISIGESSVTPGADLPCPVLTLPAALAAPGAMEPGSSGWTDLIAFLENRI